MKQWLVIVTWLQDGNRYGNCVGVFDSKELAVSKCDWLDGKQTVIYSTPWCGTRRISI